MNTTSDKQENFGLGRSLLYCCGQFGGNIVNTVFVGWVYYYYTGQKGSAVVLVPHLIMGAAIFGGRIVDAISDPLVAYWSDSTRSRLGRRRPFIFWFSPLLALSFIMLFHPIFPAGSTALAVTTIAVMGLFWFFFTAVMGPYLALYPELVTDSGERTRVATFMALCMLLATAYNDVIASTMVDKNKWNIGYSNMSLISAALCIFFLYITAITVREKFSTLPQQSQEKYSMIEAFRWTFKNKAFVIYILASVCQYLGFTAIAASKPFLVTLLMKKSEGFMIYLILVMLPGIIISFLIINILTRRIEKAKLYRFSILTMSLLLSCIFIIGRVPLPVSPATAGLILMGMLSIPIAFNMVLMQAILADIADYDYKITGHHREGMYFGMQGLLQKSATGISALMQGLLFHFLGAETGHFLGVSLLGPVAGVFGIIGYIIFLKYPLDEKTKDLKIKA